VVNLVNFGILPISLDGEERIDQGDVLLVEEPASQIRSTSEIVIKNQTKKVEHISKHELFKGPNIQSLPEFPPMPDRLEAKMGATVSREAGSRWPTGSPKSPEQSLPYIHENSSTKMLRIGLRGPIPDADLTETLGHGYVPSAAA
jgi:hypothetical protein